MPKIRPNPQLKQIVLEETNDGRDVIRYLKSTFMNIEDGVSLFGLRHKDYARSHKIAAARILARIGLEEGKRYLRRTYVRTPFRRIHPEEEDGPKREMAASTAELYRLVKKETSDGRDIIIRFVGIMKGYYPEYKPHLRMAAAKELIRQIEFDYEDGSAEPPVSEPASEPVGASLVGAHHPEPTPPESTQTESAPISEPVGASLVGAHAASEFDQHQADPVYPTHPENPASDKGPDTDQPHPERPDNPANPDSDRITDHHPNHINHSSDPNPILTPEFVIENPEVSLADIQRQMHIQDGSVHYRDYAAQHAREAESIYQSIIRRASGSYNLDEAQRKTQDLIAEFDDFMTERDPEYRPIAVPDSLITTSLTQQMDETRTYPFDPADFFDLDHDYFYYCLCRQCEPCDELDYFFEFMFELQEEYEDP